MRSSTCDRGSVPQKGESYGLRADLKEGETAASGPGEAVEGVACREHLKCFIQNCSKYSSHWFFFLQKVCGLYKTEIID